MRTSKTRKAAAARIAKNWEAVTPPLKLKRDKLGRVRVVVTYDPTHTSEIEIHESALPAADADTRLYYNGDWWAFVELANGLPRYERE